MKIRRPNVRRLPRWLLDRLTDWRLWASIAALALLTGWVVSSVATQGEVNRLRNELDCRSRISGAVTQAQGEMTSVVGNGLYQLAQYGPDSGEFREAAGAYPDADDRLNTAKEARENAEDTCAGGRAVESVEPFGSCDEARAAGVTDGLAVTDPRWQPSMRDGDGDGIACEGG